ncbi:hypothetical protein D3C80_1599060 [compost metagenome]
MQQRVAPLAHLLLEFVAVVGCDHQCRQRRSTLGIDRRHRIDTRAPAVQVVVGNQHIGHGRIDRHLPGQVLLAQGDDHFTAPLLQQRGHGRADGLVVIQHPDPRPHQSLTQRLYPWRRVN